MDILIKITQLVAALSLLVLVHELGHFMFARLFKCRVDKFYLFFNPWFSLWKKKVGDTEYGIGWLPLGGYCKIAGMVDESMDKDQMAEPAKPWEYRSKPAWQRFFIIVGGVLMNFIMAIVIYIGMTYAWGESYIKAEDVKDGFVFSVEAQEMGFCNGDKILSIDGEPVDAYNQIQISIILADKREVEIERDGQRQTINIPADKIESILNAKEVITPRIPFVVAGIAEDSPASGAGLMVGDSIVGIDSMQMTYFDQMKPVFDAHKNDTILLAISREGTISHIPIKVSDEGTIGVMYDNYPPNHYKISMMEYTLLQSIPKGIEKGVSEVGRYLKQLKLIASPETGAYKSVGGFGTMAKIFPSEWSWYAFWSITAMLSIMLAVLNILPIPALDGGHLVFILYEMITRRAPSQKIMENAQMVGFFILIALLIYANGSDLMRLFS